MPTPPSPKTTSLFYVIGVQLSHLSPVAEPSRLTCIDALIWDSSPYVLTSRSKDGEREEAASSDGVCMFDLHPGTSRCSPAWARAERTRVPIVCMRCLQSMRPTLLYSRVECVFYKAHRGSRARSRFVSLCRRRQHHVLVLWARRVRLCRVQYAYARIHSFPTL